MELILASGSPRRLELLRQIGVEPKVVVSHSNEEKTAASPAVLVQDNALAKGRDVVQQVGDAVPVLAADTVVALEGRILGKPGTPEKARAMLHQLSGRTHQVLTGLALFYQGKVWQHVEMTDRRTEVDRTQQGGMNPLPSRKKTEMMVLQMQKLRIRKTEVFLASRKTRRM